MRNATSHLVLISLLLGPLAAQAGEPLAPPREVRVVDTPSDGGNSLTVTWAPSPHDGSGTRYLIMVGEAGPEKETPTSLAGMTVVADFPSDSHYVRDARTPWWNRSMPKTHHQYDIKRGRGNGNGVKDGARYTVVVSAVRGQESMMAPALQAIPQPNWFNWNELNNLAIVALFGLGVFGSIQVARKREIFLRRIAGLDAVDEAIGRSTELGKPILYLTGAGDMSEPATIAAAVILGRVAKRVAAYETELMVPHRDPIVMAVCQEITKQSYLEAGKPDVFKEDSNFFITTDQFSYTAAVDGIMLRKKPAANFFMGSYFAESLLLTETGASTGAIQIAGTDSDHQLPFFVTTCDYTLIGEELYAASAYLSREPVQVGTLRGQDIGKAVVLGMLGIGTALATLSVMTGLDVSLVLDLFKDLK